MLAGLLDWPQATFASKVTVDSDKSGLTVIREVDNGLQTISCRLPAVVSTDLRLNEPRFATLPNIMKARNKPIQVFPLSQFVQSSGHLNLLSVAEPSTRKSGVKLDSVSSLLNILRTKGFIK